MMTTPQKHRRHQAVARYLAGEPIEAICCDMRCAKSWLYKWKNRYRFDDPTWARSQSTQPRHNPRRLPPVIAQWIVALYRVGTPDGTRCSAAAIQEVLQQQGLEPIPSIRTIYRIIQRQGSDAD
jgi:putative transposase